MKNTVFIGLLCLLSACAKQPLPTLEPKQVPVIELGKGSVLRNGIPWEVPFTAKMNPYYPGRFWLNARIRLLSPVMLDENMVIHNLPLRTGKFPIKFYTTQGRLNGELGALYALRHEIDQPTGDFRIDTTRSGHFVEILRYDSLTRTVEGRFAMFMLNDKMIKPIIRNVPDKVDFTEGKFHLRIED